MWNPTKRIWPAVRFVGLRIKDIWRVAVGFHAEPKKCRSTPLAAGCLTFVGMSLPWAHVGRLTVSGWFGWADFVGVPCPGCLVAVVAAIAIGCLCSAPSMTRRSWLMPLTMSGYGIFHSGFVALAFTATRGMRVGVGIPITMLSFVVIVFFAFCQRNSLQLQETSKESMSRRA